MTAYTEDDVTAAAAAIRASVRQDSVAVARAALAAVAPLIAARALREAAARCNCESCWLARRARAEQVNP